MTNKRLFIFHLTKTYSNVQFRHCMEKFKLRTSTNVSGTTPNKKDHETSSPDATLQSVLQKCRHKTWVKHSLRGWPLLFLFLMLSDFSLTMSLRDMKCQTRKILLSVIAAMVTKIEGLLGLRGSTSKKISVVSNSIRLQF